MCHVDQDGRPVRRTRLGKAFAGTAGSPEVTSACPEGTPDSRYDPQGSPGEPNETINLDIEGER
ncbi:hypothetical protein GCM10028790_06090 [Micromonospora taraxaci]